MDAKWLNLHSTARINLLDGDSNCTGYLIADHVPDLDDGLRFQSTNLVYASSSSAIHSSPTVPNILGRQIYEAMQGEMCKQLLHIILRFVNTVRMIGGQNV